MEFWDDYEHIDPKLTYISESMKTREIEELVTYELSGCDCEKECSPTSCSCLQRSGALYLFPDKMQLSNYVLSMKSANRPLYECNDHCKCAHAICGNKLVQLGPRRKLQIMSPSETTSKTKGLSLITGTAIEKGKFICEYAGEVINELEAKKRFETYFKMSLNHNYIFCINENFGNKNEKTFIDPTFYGNIGRYINHSCQPNCILVPVRIHDEIPKLCIFAGESIGNNTELTFDYGDTNNSSDNLKMKACLCGSHNCRKYLPFDRTI